MAGNITWRSGNFAMPLQASGQGRQVGNAEMYLCSGILYNDGRSGQLALYCTAEITLAASGFGSAVNNNQTVDLYLLPAAVSSGQYATGATSGLPANALKGSFITPVSGNTPRLKMNIEGIPLMPLAYQGWIQNNTGQTMASGWSLDFVPNEQAYT